MFWAICMTRPDRCWLEESLSDLRALDAGTYYLRVYNPFAASQTAPLPFTLEASVPIPGYSHPLSDFDEIHGDDGNDIIIGNKHIDHLFGDRGADYFIADAVEVRDQENGEFIGSSVVPERIKDSQADLKRLDPVIQIPDNALLVGLAKALGMPVTTWYLGLTARSAPDSCWRNGVVDPS